MLSLNELARERTAVSQQDLEWLHLLLADWQLLADLSFADLILWLPLRTGNGFVAAAQMRPTTGPTVHHDDVVGREVRRGLRPQLDTAFDERRILGQREPGYAQDLPVREETIPVVRGDSAIAVVSRHTNLAAARTPSRLELTYLRTADDLARMISQGRFPVIGPLDQIERSPRVGDGLIRLDDDGTVVYASPNALSAFRRLGLTTDLAGRHLGEMTARLSSASQPVDETLSVAVSGAAPRQVEVEAAGAAVRLRVIPLVDQHVRVAAVVLCRDVTEVRRRERELVSKDATIREIHHRVKNNLQTVASLLRLQARRLDSDEARHALEEAQRRVASIALVHETLAHTLDAVVGFDEVAARVTELVATERVGVAAVHVRREGQFGELPPEVASALSLVLVELLQNAVEHGLGERGGTVTVAARRRGNELLLVVEDDGVGLPPAFDVGAAAGVRGLGLQIVRTLVETELGGEITLQPASRVGGGRGCAATVRLTLTCE